MGLMIVAEGLKKKFGDTQALRDIDLHVEENTIHGLIGPNGAGKSTIIRIISTLVKPDAGFVIVDGHPLDEGGLIRRAISVVPEAPRLHEYKTGREELRFQATIRGIPKDEADLQIKKLGLEDVIDRKIDGYSTGMRKRLALSIALVAHPRILLLDEPMAGLDPEMRRIFKDLISNFSGTVLISDHELHTIDEVCDRVTIIKEGITLIEDSMISIKARSSIEEIFMGYMR
jgi:ABC-2 type transport system ATP-binding protein